jgi:DNA-binding NarL/FixJ family response regulator
MAPGLSRGVTWGGMPRKGRAAARGRPPIRVLMMEERTASWPRPKADVVIVNAVPRQAAERLDDVLRRQPRTRVIVLNLQEDVAFLESALTAGAAQCRVREDEAAGRHPVLSVREHQVLDLLARGHTRREIAERLAIGVKSVETYRSRLTRKLGVQSRAELVRYALESGLLNVREE